ncbi:hypothetical protein M1843_15560 [Isoptericola sp. 4D.3]|uniref:DUF998 domain-containing protein n=1 Tax=Isoptericola peretonis TaxID=2918523 RepID=A0ABT0J6P2_9MICO|nr:hypothetical protein [Isoptericola sp. 4D.3]
MPPAHAPARAPLPRRTRRAALVGVACTLLVTLALVTGDLLYRLDDGVATDPSSPWKIDEDRSVAELVASAALLVAAALLARRARTLPQSPVLAAWAAVLLLVVADDLLRIHETVGGAVASRAGLTEAFGLDPQGWGELAVWGVLGAVSLAVLVATFLRSGPTARRVSWWLLGCVGVLGLAAVGVDMLAIVVEPFVAGDVSWVVAMLESAGELVAAGLFLTVAWCFHRATATVPAPSPEAVAVPA